MLYFSREMLAIVQYLDLTDEQMKDKRTITEATQHYMDSHYQRHSGTQKLSLVSPTAR